LVAAGDRLSRLEGGEQSALRNELINGEIIYTLTEAQVLIEQWRVHYNTIRPHSALGYRPPAAEIIVPGNELPMNHEAA
jgi:transposase InsO family protein